MYLLISLLMTHQDKKLFLYAQHKWYYFNTGKIESLRLHYGNNLIAGVPPISYCLPFAIPVAVSIASSLSIVIIALGVCIHKHEHTRMFITELLIKAQYLHDCNNTALQRNEADPDGLIY